MIALQRHRTILSQVLEAGVVRVCDLAKDLNVTEETIRRDLGTLSKQGVLARTHGGAIALETKDDHRADLPHDQRSAACPLQKEAIARMAVTLIKPRSVIALDSSSTACQLARHIPNQPLTVVTNSLVVCSILVHHHNIEVICTGGTLDPEAMAFFGLNTQRDLERLNIEQLFFSCRGLDLHRGLSESNDRHAAVKLSMIKASQSRVLLIDTSKLGLASTVFYTPLNAAHHVVLDRPGNPESQHAVDALREHGLHVDEVDLIQNA
ncbi:MAG: DeoR/GlpR family DNA-binding transcription regulator [Algisphaera sp.]